ncbi:MAG: AtpZ/AtpI family protein [Alphaproteobacteria bacterium]
MHDETDKRAKRDQPGTISGRTARPDGLDGFADKLRKVRVEAGLKAETPDPHATGPNGQADDVDDAPRQNSFGMAMRLSTDLVAAVLVGGFIGWMLDDWLGTKPVLLLIFFPLGVAAGIVNVFRTANRMNQQSEAANSDAADDGSDNRS